MYRFHASCGGGVENWPFLCYNLRKEGKMTNTMNQESLFGEVLGTVSAFTHACILPKHAEKKRKLVIGSKQRSPMDCGRCLGDIDVCDGNCCSTLFGD